MRHLLVINPNTSASISALLQSTVQAEAGARVRVRTVTARFGAPYIADEASYAVAAHAVLDAWAADLASGAPPADAVLIGCFGDPGLLALREASPVPVTGLAEAAFHAAARHGRYAVVTGGARWAPCCSAWPPRSGCTVCSRASTRWRPPAPRWPPTRRPHAACWRRPAATRSSATVRKP